MKKYLMISLLLSALFSSQLYADSPATQINVDDLTIDNTEQYAFVGVEYAYQNLEQTLESEDIYFPEVGQSLFGLRFGFQNRVWRTMFTYEDNFASYRAFLIEADRTVLAGMMGGKGRIYLGVSGGWIEYYGDRTILDDTVEFEDYGYAYGGNVGFMYYITDRIDLSFEYRYLFTSSSYTLDTIQGPGIALHYFF
jgi:hypothetical protein